MIPSTSVPPTEENFGSLPISATEPYALLWQPTHRNRYTPINNNPTNSSAARNSTTCFFVGIKESIDLSTTNGQAWLWRRIVFTYKGLLIPATNYRDYATREVELSDESKLLQRPNTSLPAPLTSDLYEKIFRGRGSNTNGLIPKDWINNITAPIDTTQITPLYDKTMSIRSGNNLGCNFTVKRWHPIRKNIVYDDEEDGTEVIGSPNSTQGKPGCGDVYILDLISGNGVDDVTTGSFYFNPVSTVYWHER